jgi:hypothetical protein
VCLFIGQLLDTNLFDLIRRERVRLRPSLIVLAALVEALEYLCSRARRCQISPYYLLKQTFRDAGPGGSWSNIQ